MSRRFIALVLGATTAISLASTQARAQSTEEIAQILGGIALLAIIADAIEEDDDGKKKSSKSISSRSSRHAHARDHDHHRHGYHGHKKRKYVTLPARCRIHVKAGYRHKQVFYTERCLDRHFRGARHLPRRCEVTVIHDRRYRDGYFERCLDRYGYRTPKH